MNNQRHPEEIVLLQFLDGELPKRQSRKIQDHLAACWECRSGLQDLQSTVQDCVRYRKQVLLASLPVAPQPWEELNFAAVDAEIASESLPARLGRWLSPRRNTPLRWVLSGAMALALTITVVRQLRETPNVEAAVLLRNAVAVSQTRPLGVRKVRITTSTRQITRVIGGAPVRPAAGEQAIASLFEAAHYDWNNPLSAASFAAWRDSLAEKTDEVASADPASYSIRTSTPRSELLTATLVLRKNDFAPLSGRFEFRNREWVEITDLVDQLNLPASTVAGAAGGVSRQPDAPPVPFFEPSPDTTPVNDELQVVSALHQLGADLGDPLEISRDGRQVVVSGTGVTPQRQQQIHNALDRLPHVVVRFSDPGFPASAPVQGEPATSHVAAAPTDKQTNTARIEQRLGGRPQFERFSGQLLDWTDAAMSRAYALRRLSQQFPPAVEQQLTPAERRTLHSLGRDHLVALVRDLDRIQNTVSPILSGLGASARPAESATAAAWQPASEQLLTSARRAESLLASVLGITSTPASADSHSQLLTALTQFHAELELCQRLLSYDDVRQSR